MNYFIKVVVNKGCYMHLCIGFYMNLYFYFSCVDVAYIYNLSISEAGAGVAISLRLVWAT